MPDANAVRLIRGASDDGLYLLYGGTFDPVHDGHLAITRAARDALATAVHLMPAADPPHRAPPGANAAHRARMLDLAVAGERGLHVDRREIQRHAHDPQARSYSVDTLRALRAERGAAYPLALLVGADSFLGLPQWKDWRALFELAHLVVAERPGSAIDEAMPSELRDAVRERWATGPADLRATPGGRVLRLRQPLTAESASDVRARIREGRDWRDAVPAAVAAYILRHRLYANPGAASPPL